MLAPHSSLSNSTSTTLEGCSADPSLLGMLAAIFSSASGSRTSFRSSGFCIRASLIVLHSGDARTVLMNCPLSSAPSSPALSPLMYSLSLSTSAATSARRGLPSTVSISVTFAFCAASLSMMLPKVTLKWSVLPARGWFPSSVTSSSVTFLMTAICPVASCITIPGSIFMPSGGSGIWSMGTTATLSSSYSPYASDASQRTSRLSPIFRP
mmetsp:Transcript_36028/g.87689  ORF Transcript_36028/g.87689 Transcript_36028/m.87689 type:complete len:210 (-) Transcript_36028:446-1075(-)